MMDEFPLPEERATGDVVETRVDQATPSATAPRNDPYASLRHRDYRWFAIASLVVSVGYNMQSMAVGWELYARTGSLMALGWVGFVQFVPIVGLSLPAGHLADRLDRRRVLAGAHALSAFASAGLAALSLARGPVWLIYLCLFVAGVARALSGPAAASLLPLLVPRAAFANAVTWKSSGFHLASVIGPAAGGALIAAFHSAAPVYLIKTALTLVFVAVVVALKPRRPQRPEEAITLNSLLAGLRFVLGAKLILAAITLDMFAVLLGGATALLPAYAEDILEVGPTGLGWLRAAPALGAFVMGVAIAYLPPMRRAGRTLLWVVAGFGAVTILFGVSQWFWLSLLALFAAGALDQVSVVVRHTLVQLRTPDELRGRVSAVNGVFISCSNELGGFRAGSVAALAGPVFSVVSGGVATILVVVAVARLWPQIARLRSLQEDG
jgi:MFS family permease